MAYNFKRLRPPKKKRRVASQHVLRVGADSADYEVSDVGLREEERHHQTVAEGIH